MKALNQLLKRFSWPEAPERLYFGPPDPEDEFVPEDHWTGMRMAEHPQVMVEWNGGQVCVDEALATIIMALWRDGRFTWASCQGNEATAAKKAHPGYLYFIRDDDAVWCMEIFGGDGWVKSGSIVRFPRQDLPRVEAWLCQPSVSASAANA
jgi:hypothetical protein